MVDRCWLSVGLRDLCRGVAEVVRDGDLDPGIAEDLRALLGVRTGHPHDDGHVDVDLVVRGDDAVREDIAAEYPAEDVDEDLLDVRDRTR